MTDELVLQVLTAIGINSVVVAVVLVVAKWLGANVIRTLIDARVKEGVEARLRTLQLDLDKDLDRHRGLLERDAEGYRSRLSREATDYAIWAQRRHEATTALFGRFLQLETTVTSMADIASPDLASVDAAHVETLLERIAASEPDAEVVRRHFRDRNSDAADRVLESLLVRARRSRVIEARNAAHEAYYASALYLSDEVDVAAKQVMDHFHEYVVEYEIPRGERPQPFPLKTKLRFFMLEFQNRARADLSRSTSLLRTSAVRTTDTDAPISG
jgi:hypothetical protein